MKIGIFGGSFDPVHQGHLAVAGYALSELNLDKIYFVPAYQNPLKSRERIVHGRPQGSPLRRISELRKAIQHNPKFFVSDIELKRKGLSYTIDTLKYFKKKFHGHALYFLAGADQLRNFSRWKSPEEVLKLCRFTLFTRPGTPLRAKDKRFLLVPMPPVDISSTEIRRKKSKLKRK